MSAKKKQDSPEKIVVELDVVDHLTKRIDHYLFKKWPDIFIEENFKEFKEDLYSKAEKVIGAEDRIQARIIEAEKRFQKCGIEIREFMEKMADRISYNVQLELKNWWKFWKRKK